MATEHHVNKSMFKIGALVRCTDLLGNELQGEVMAFDAPTGTTYIRRPAVTKKPNLFDYNLVNVNLLRKAELLKEAAVVESSTPLPNFALEKLEFRRATNIEDKMKKADFVKPGSCPTGRRLITTISKTIEDVRWSGDEILVMKSVTIKPPYLVENCHNLHDNQQEALTLVKKLVEKFHKDHHGAKQQTTSSVSSPAVASGNQAS